MGNQEYLSKIAEYGQLIVISGASGVGKRTIINEYLKDHPNAYRCVSLTTRDMKPGEVDGEKHWFVSNAEFERLARTNQLFEYSYYHRIGYGTTRTAVEEARKEGKNVILIEDVVGAMRVRALCPDATLIFLLTPDWDELEGRIRERHKGEEEKDIAEYILSAQEEILCAGQYDYILINDTIEKTVNRLSQIIHGNRYRSQSMANFLKSYIESEIDSELATEVHDYALSNK
jgi:guanylate kinase